MRGALGRLAATLRQALRARWERLQRSVDALVTRIVLTVTQGSGV